MSKLVIGFLADHPQLEPIVGDWLHETWFRKLGLTRSQTDLEIRHRLQTNRVPLSIVAIRGEMVVGTASLVYDWPPAGEKIVCLAGVYVLPQARQQHVGRRLCRWAAEEARRLGLSSLGLYTTDRASFYGRLGWRTEETRREASLDVPAVFMRLDLQA